MEQWTVGGGELPPPSTVSSNLFPFEVSHGSVWTSPEPGPGPTTQRERGLVFVSSGHSPLFPIPLLRLQAPRSPERRRSPPRRSLRRRPPTDPHHTPTYRPIHRSVCFAANSPANLCIHRCPSSRSERGPIFRPLPLPPPARHLPLIRMRAPSFSSSRGLPTLVWCGGNIRSSSSLAPPAFSCVNQYLL